MSNKHFPDRRCNDEEAMKKIMKAAIKEWLDEQFAKFGKWTALGITAMVLVLIAYGIVHINGVPWGK